MVILRLNVGLIGQLSIFLDVPSEPVGPVILCDIQRTSCTIEWKPPLEGHPLTGYSIERKEVTRSFYSKVQKVEAHITKYCVSNLIDGNEYYFRIIAENEIGGSKPLEMADPVLIKSPYGKMHTFFQIFSFNFYFYFIY